MPQGIFTETAPHTRRKFRATRRAHVIVLRHKEEHHYSLEVCSVLHWEVEAGLAQRGRRGYLLTRIA